MANEYYVSNPSTAADPANGLASRAYAAEFIGGLYNEKFAWKKLLNKTSDAGFGESVSVTLFPTLTAVDVTNSTGAYSNINTSITASVVVMDKQKAVPARITAPIISQYKGDIKAAFAQESGKALGASCDIELAKLAASLTENSAGSLGAALTDAYILAAMTELVKDNLNFVDANQYVWMLPASQFGAIKGLKSYAAYQINAGSTMTDGGADIRPMVETLHGIDVVFSNAAGLDVTGGKYGMLLHRDSVGVAFSKQFTMEPPMRVPGTTAIEMLTHCIYGINVLDATRACLIKTV
jgi:hypothetical protein